MTHLTSDELVDQLYGTGDQQDHLRSCADCSERFEQLLERRKMGAESVSASQEFLAAQRRNIYARMGERRQSQTKWVPTLAAGVLLVAAGVFAYRPADHQAMPVAKPEIDQAQLFSDVYSMEQSMEPNAAKPIHALFEQDSQ